MKYKWHHYLNHFQNWDSTGQKLNLTTLRYELQGLKYEVEIAHVKPTDSLHWVGAQFLAATYFDMSWNEIVSYLEFVRNGSQGQANTLLRQMKHKEEKAIRFYLQQFKPSNDSIVDHWMNHISAERLP